MDSSLSTRIMRSAILVLACASLCACPGKDRDLPFPDTRIDIPPDTTDMDTQEDTAQDPQDAGEEEPEPLVYEMRLIDLQQVGSNLRIFVTVRDQYGNPVTDLESEDFLVIEDSTAIDADSTEARLSVQKHSLDHVWRTLVLVDTSRSVLVDLGLDNVMAPVRSFARQITDLDTRSRAVSVGTFDGAPDLRPLVTTYDTDLDGDGFYFTSLTGKLETDLDVFLEPECSAPADCADSPGRPNCESGICIDTSMDLYGAVIDGIDAVEAALEAEERVGIPRGGSLVIFTDSGDEAERHTSGQVASALDGTDIFTFVVGLGVDADLSVARDGTFGIDSTTEMAAMLSEIMAVKEAVVEGIYLISYCTSARSGSHTVTLNIDEQDQWLDIDFTPAGEVYCIPDAPLTACEGLMCGAGEYGYHCGDCEGDEVCSADGTSCETVCSTGSCGPSDDTEPFIECGSCPGVDVCSALTGLCCTQDCTGRECGPDPVCEESCGTCTAPDVCNVTTGLCE